jgi:U2 small nuclear ribonucleoprotein A'
MIQKDQHDAIDFTDNSITVLGNLPLMRRLRTLHLSNNRIMSISPNIHLSCPGLSTLVLTNNNIQQLGDLEPLKELRHLQYLSLLGNPVREQKYYRSWIIYRCKPLRVLDFTRIRDKVSISPAHYIDVVMKLF